MITGRMVGRPTDLEMIKGLEGELTKVIKDFERAMDVETLRLAQKSGEHLLSQCGDSAFSVTSCRPTRAGARGARSFVSTA
jgi:hypothetical protein